MSAVAGVPKVRENGRAEESSPGLSSPPTPSSPTHAIQSRIAVNPTSHAHNAQASSIVGGEKASVTVGVGDSVNAVAKKPRKKRELSTTKKTSDPKSAPNSAPGNDGKEPPPKIKKPRAPYGSGASKRKSKTAANADDKVAAVQLPGQSKITDSLAPPSPVRDIKVHATPDASRNGKNEVIDISRDASHHESRAPTPRSSGQNYDPVRSSTMQPRSFPPTPSQQILKSSSPPRLTNYGSASNSPSISSLIDPPQPKRDDEYRGLSPPPKRQKFTPPETVLKSNAPLVGHQQLVRESTVEKPVGHKETRDTVNHVSNAQDTSGPAATFMDIDQPEPSTKPAPVKRKSTTSTGTATPANTTKPPRQKEAAVAVATGNGLLSTEMFGGGSGSTNPEKTAPTVIIDVPLNGETNKYINFAKLAEERYGFNALYPRLAAQRERLARVAAAGAALEKENKANGSGMSGDEMSVDLSDGEAAGDDSNVEMGGMGLLGRDNSGQSPADGSDGAVVKRKKRVMKEDQYDKDDPFVDDTEMAWEEQQAASKDGFFVYSGPLVPEGEKPNVERFVTCLYVF